MATVFLCRHCARSLARLRRRSTVAVNRQIRWSTDKAEATTATPKTSNQTTEKKDENSILYQKLQEATEEALLTGGRAGRRAIEEAGFDDELKSRLFNKIADAKFSQEHRRAIAAAGLDTETMTPLAGAGQGTRDIAAAQPWSGQEDQADTVLRMLHDAQKPLAPSLRSKPKIPDPVTVDLRLRRTPTQSPGQRVANAREKASAYVGMGMTKSQEEESKKGKGKGKDATSGLTEQEREEFRKEFRERFAPDYRAMPNTVAGLAALANERIEDAIARGQFRDIPRGPGIERDTRADNPFIDTTEYIMNKMIQRQDLVPPWIEKQQDLLKTARQFRTRLRTDWKRHAARTLASRGGSLAEQIKRAEANARAEEVHNPRKKHVDQMTVPTNATDDAVMGGASTSNPSRLSNSSSSSSAKSSSPEIEIGRPFRDPKWEAAEHAYMELAIQNLNTLTRSYNLMAPDLAKKPYFSLDRELHACFADVAPELPKTIRDRALKPQRRTEITEAVGRRMMKRLVGNSEGKGAVKVYESKTPHFGFKEMWKQWWGKDS